jgi:hypothetical protein
MENEKELFACCECTFEGYYNPEEIKKHQDSHRPKPPNLKIFVVDEIRMKDKIGKQK